MKVELNIADDRELRSAIKDLIKGEVASIMRGEIKSIISDLVKEGAYPKDAKDLETIVRAEVASYTKEQLKSTGYNNNVVKEIAREEVGKILREMFENAKYNVERL
jgi:hypothetical protein